MIRRRAWWLAMLLLQLVVAASIVDWREPLTDTDAYLRAAMQIRQGAPIYGSGGDVFNYQYFPMLAIALVPFTWLPTMLVGWLWTAAIAAVFVLTQRRLLAELPPIAPWPLAGLWLAALPFLASELAAGQANVFMMAASLMAIAAVRRGASGRAAAWWVLAVSIKPLALILTPWLVVTDRRALWRGLAGLVAALVLSAVIAPHSTVREWLPRVGTDGLGATTGPANLSLAATGVAVMNHQGRGLAAAAVVLVLIAVALVAHWRRRPNHGAAITTDGVVVLALIPLVTPEGWFAQTLDALPLAVALLASAPRWTRGARLAGVGLVVVAFVCGAFLYWIAPWPSTWHGLTAVLLGAFALAVVARRRGWA